MPLTLVELGRTLRTLFVGQHFIMAALTRLPDAKGTIVPDVRISDHLVNLRQHKPVMQIADDTVDVEGGRALLRLRVVRR